jgi:hypothetical protein
VEKIIKQEGARIAYLFNAKGAVFISAWGIAPGILVRISSALKARFICAPDCFSRSVSQFVAQVAREFANAVCGIETRRA